MTKPLLVIGDRNLSSWSLRAWLAMRKSGAVFDEEMIPLDTEAFERRIGAYSPTRRVPVLIDGDTRVWESLGICEYANEAFADGALWPRERARRAGARALSAEMHAGFGHLRERMPMQWTRPRGAIDIDDALASDVSRVRAIWRECRVRAAGGPWLFGPFSIVDAMFAPVVLRFHSYVVECGATEQAYMRTVLEDADMRVWLEAAEREG